MEELCINNLIANNEDDISPAINPEEKEIPQKEEFVNEVEIGSANNEIMDDEKATGGISEHLRVINFDLREEKGHDTEERETVEEESETEKGNETVRIVGVFERDGWKYLGEVKKDQRDGFGICQYTNKKYIGQWKNDVKEGWGRLIYDNGEVLQGEIANDNFEGFCERMNPKKQTYIQGFYLQGKFTEIVIVSNDSKVFEGEALPEIPRDYQESPYIIGKSPHLSLGKLYSTKKPDKYFWGEVYKYKEECGFGICVKKNTSMYLGEMRNKTFVNYIEIYSIDGASFFAILKNGIKHGLSFNFTKDSRVSFGKYQNDIKNGPFLLFSNSQNLQKSNVRMELYHQGFKSKVTEKLEASQKYLQLYYPEYCKIFEYNYAKIIAGFNKIVLEEASFVQKMIKGAQASESS